MAMRDPGTPGRNPFFDHSADTELGDFVDGVDESVDDPFASDRFSATDFNFGPEPDDGNASGRGGAGGWPGGSGDPFGTLVALVDALQTSQPEATEHLVAAAHELVLAVKTVVDATEAVLAAQRASARPDAAPTASEAHAAADASGADEPPASPPTPPASGVRRIDLA